MIKICIIIVYNSKCTGATLKKLLNYSGLNKTLIVSIFFKVAFEDDIYNIHAKKSEWKISNFLSLLSMCYTHFCDIACSIGRLFLLIC